jgi:predicted PurR-regulated permease PerM
MFKTTIYVKSVLQLIALAGAAWLLYTVRGLLVYIIIAALLALITKPLTNFICRLRGKRFYVPRGLSAIITVALVVFLFGLVTRLLIPALLNEFTFLKGIDFSTAYETLGNEISVIRNGLANYDLQLANIEENVREAIVGLLSFKNVESTISGLLGGLGNVAIALFSILFMLFFFLKEENLTSFIISNFFTASFSTHVSNILPKLKRTLFRYAIGLSLQMTGVFLIVFTGLRIVGIESALVIAVFAAFINLIPYVGPMIGASFGLILGLGQAYALDPSIAIGFLALKIALVFLITQLTDNFIFQPLIFSTSINAHPLEIFIIISIAGLLGGILGMVIAVPTYSMLRIVAKEFLAHSKFIQALTKNV